MGYGPITVFTGTIASGASTLTQVDLSKAWNKVYVEVSTMSTAAAFDVYGAPTTAGTFRPVFERVNTAPVQYQTMFVASGVGANGGLAPIDPGYQYVQLRASAVVSGGVQVKFLCWD
jgi:hypothetical protein